jgi:hypothetical protein
MICARNSASSAGGARFDILLEQLGFEADDLIATYMRQACEAAATRPSWLRTRT